MTPRRPADWSLYLVTDRAIAGARSLEWIVERALEGGVTAVQIREKGTDTRAFVEEARRLLEIVHRAGRTLIVNDRVDVALAVDADGVHVGQDDLPAADARRLIGPDRWLGVTAANVDEARAAERAGADYVGCSAVFATPTKVDTGPPIGPEGLRRMVQALTVPVVAIGGIGPGNAGEVAATGVAGLAVVSAIVGAGDPRDAAASLSSIIGARRSPVGGSRPPR